MFLIQDVKMMSIIENCRVPK